MHISNIEITNFRNYEHAEIDIPSTGVTVIHGDNGQGKSNLLEAIGFSARMRSFRGATPDTLVGKHGDSAIIRADGARSSRDLLVEIEINKTKKNKAFLNKQPIKRSKDLDEMVLVSFFSPDDLVLIKGGPSERRRYLDEISADLSVRNDQLQREFERILKQRNALLRQAKGRLTSDISSTLDVWDEKLAEVGEELNLQRSLLVEELRPLVKDSYTKLSETNASPQKVDIHMSTDWYVENAEKSLLSALHTARTHDLIRGVTTVGPHRDEVVVALNEMPARTHASQGEQRTVALSLRLASHQLLTKNTGFPPVLLLDDVFSELDEKRSTSLVESLQDSQTLLTSAGFVPPKTHVSAHFTVEGGKIR